MEKKKCSICLKTKAVSRFSPTGKKSSSSKKRYMSYCRDCRNTQRREKRKADGLNIGRSIKPLDELLNLPATKICSICNKEKDICHFPRQASKLHKTYGVYVRRLYSFCYSCRWDRDKKTLTDDDKLLKKEYDRKRRELLGDELREKERTFKRKNIKRLSAENTARQRRDSRELSDTWIRRTLHRSPQFKELGILGKDIPQELVELKRKELKAKRHAKQLKKSNCL